ncbi:FbpB family small basic protein [Halobacillus sp. Marseille-Q1614]|nr:FbpB family small basic protein [Halobacillus sp. Marseille-Q1614]
MRPNRPTFEELVSQNKEELLKDQQALDKIDDLIDKKRLNPKEKNRMIN